MTAAGKISVLIVDDSTLARSMLRSILEDEGDFQVVGEAVNGREAVEMARALRPDLVTMDLEMPEMGGIEAIEEIMCSKARPILVVSGIADAENAYRAVSKGAIEVTAKPDVTCPKAVEDFVDKARLVSKIPVITMPRTGVVGAARAAASASPISPHSVGGSERGLVAIASSTGGPQALAVLLARFAADFPCPVVVAQHIADGFAQGMADWLTTLSTLPVALGADGQVLAPGHVYLSPSELNMTVEAGGRLRLLERRPGQIYRPSCDALLTSVARIAGERAVGVILTGMGSDGVAGMEAIRKAGGATFAQDEAGSVIFGMNAVAIERGWVQRVLPLEEMASALREAVVSAGRAAP